jgi:hypothetical protein
MPLAARSFNLIPAGRGFALIAGRAAGHYTARGQTARIEA